MKKIIQESTDENLSKFFIKKKIKNTPSLPGVYRMKDVNGEVLYVGKAKNLKKRIASYFNKGTHSSQRTQVMVEQIADFEFTITNSENEALLLENNLIKTIKPRYNVIFKDDKTYPYISLSSDTFPRLFFYRGVPKKGQQSFGPFPDIGAVHESIHLLQKIFKLRTCENTIFKNRSRPCLQYQIDRCTAPCVNKISQEAYKDDVQQALLFLEGGQQEVINKLNRQMLLASEVLNYELATVYRNRIQSLRHIQTPQFVSEFFFKNADIIAVIEQEKIHCVNVVMIRGGRHIGDKSLFPHNTNNCDITEILNAFLTQYYSSTPIPETIILSHAIELHHWRNILSEQAKNKIKVIARQTKNTKQWVKRAIMNAQLALNKHLSETWQSTERLQCLAEVLNIANLQRIECFDISHTQGEATVASCVVFDEGKIQNKQYRRYNIANITAGDDYTAIKIAVYRHYSKIAKEEGKIPDLIMIDGGKGQLNSAITALSELGIKHIPIIGVAKGEGRKAGLEQLFFPNNSAGERLPSDHKGLHLIQQIRDEAHRFAITGHRNKRNKNRMQSVLEDIKGIGQKRRRALILHFGGIIGIKNASIYELAQVAGITEKLAEDIYTTFHN